MIKKVFAIRVSKIYTFSGFEPCQIGQYERRGTKIVQEKNNKKYRISQMQNSYQLAQEDEINTNSEKNTLTQLVNQARGKTLLTVDTTKIKSGTFRFI